MEVWKCKTEEAAISPGVGGSAAQLTCGKKVLCSNETKMKHFDLGRNPTLTGEYPENTI